MQIISKQIKTKYKNIKREEQKYNSKIKNKNTWNKTEAEAK